mmetsp:Transcript_20973/g.32504  ORF Transcript_20973/g.32504 Transcript_20973/m.32504 type:complete len:303 (-) Transcript_20973:3245-4153(-)
MSISQAIVIRVQEDAHEDIAAAFPVHVFDVLSSPDNESHLELLGRLGRDVHVVHVSNLAVLLADLCPHLNHSLSDHTRRVEQITVLDGLVLDRLPALTEVAVVQLQEGGSDQVVAEEIVVVVCFDFDHRSSWEIHDEIVALMELRVRSIKLVVLDFIELGLAALDDQIGVRQREGVSLCEVEALDHVEADLALRFLVQLLQELLLVNVVTDHRHDLQLAKAGLSDHFTELLQVEFYLIKLNVFPEIQLLDVKVEGLLGFKFVDGLHQFFDALRLRLDGCLPLVEHLFVVAADDSLEEARFDH